MAVVWKGRHIRQGIPIAAKVITTDKARSPLFHASFRNEVRAVAGLDHPGIVMVFDHGEITEEAERLSSGHLVAGSPYLVMELATGGSLFRVRKSFQWRDLRQMLRALLDALAHAHARGVIHRDLKPGNVLRATAADVRPGIKLTDFGLAHALEQRSDNFDAEEIAGTPQYMAPEQFEGRWRDFGPWTDLYALGCMAYELACGRRPFDGESFWEIFYAHKDGPPRLLPRIAIPRGFEAWIMRLMAANPADRFQRAADAAWALLNLGEPDSDEIDLNPGADEDEVPIGAESFFVDRTLSYPEDWSLRGRRESMTGELLSDMLFGVEDEVAPDSMPSSPVTWPTNVEKDLPSLPEIWQRPSAPMASMKLVGAGLGLYGLRNIPIVGRKEERTLLWNSLRRTQAQGTTACVILEGAAGVGKSRLISWICERAHELGGAAVFKATHDPVAGRNDGLPRMVATSLRCTGLSREIAIQRCKMRLTQQGVVDDYEWHALTELMLPSDGQKRSGERVVRFSTPNQRYVLIRRLIEREAGHRPAIIWLDDAHWGSDAIEFAHYLLKVQRHASRCPILILMSVQNEALDDQTLESSQLVELAEHEKSVRIRVDPLEQPDHVALVEQLLGLEGHLAAEVAQRTAGNPLFAIQLVGDWVQRGILDVSGRGFILRTGEHAIIPDDIHQLWTRRIERFLETRPEADRLVLELAAALGQNVDHGEWEVAAVLGQLTVPGPLVEDLTAVGLAHIEESDHWSFAHNMLRESLARSAAEAGRWQGHNLACALMLRNQYADSQRLIAHRLGNHLLEGGRPAEALEPLLEGAVLKTNSSAYRLAHRLLERRKAALDKLQVPDSDLLWGEGWLVEAQCCIEEGRVADTIELADRVGLMSRQHGWSKQLPEALRLLGHASRMEGNLKRAKACFTQALKLFEASRDRLGVGSCLRGLGEVARQQQRHDDAETLLKRALTVFESIDDKMGMANCVHGMGIVARKKGRIDHSLMLYRRAQAIFESIGYQHGVVNCLNSVAEVSRYQGLIDDAMAGYERTLLLAEAIGSNSGLLARLNLALVFNEVGEYTKAEHLLIEARAELQSHGRKSLMGAVEIVILPCLASRGDWTGWDRSFRSGLELLSETGMVEADIAHSASTAAQLALQAGMAKRARHALALSRSQWLALGDEARVSQVDAVLEKLPV